MGIQSHATGMKFQMGSMRYNVTQGNRDHKQAPGTKGAQQGPAWELMTDCASCCASQLDTTLIPDVSSRLSESKEYRA